MLLGGRDSSVGIATGLTARVRFPAGARLFSSLQHPDGFWGQPRLLSNGYRREISPGIKRPEREVDSTAPCVFIA
jgi:hypothetical protein